MLLLTHMSIFQVSSCCYFTKLLNKALNKFKVAVFHLAWFSSWICGVYFLVLRGTVFAKLFCCKQNHKPFLPELGKDAICLIFHSPQTQVHLHACEEFLVLNRFPTLQLTRGEFIMVQVLVWTKGVCKFSARGKASWWKCCWNFIIPF